jgi:hypothetical protein
MAKVDVVKLPGPSKAEGRQRRDTHDNNREPDALHTVGDTADDNGSRAGHGLVGQLLGRAELVARGVLRPLADSPTSSQTDNHTEGEQRQKSASSQ